MSTKRGIAAAPLVALALTLAHGPVAAQEAGSGPLGDAGIAHIAVTANAIDVEMAELARERASGEGVLQFAATMIRDHSAVNEQAAALAGRLGLTPADNDVSRSLRASAESTERDLRALDGEEFDAAYVGHEVAYHRAVLDALDATLIPGANNAELRALLEQARAAVAAHLEHALELQTTLGGTR